MLEEADLKGFQHIVSWVNDGSAFKVHKVEEFVSLVMPMYFDQTEYDFFRRQLNMYGFARANQREFKDEISHPYFVQGARYLCKLIRRKEATPTG